MIDLAPEDFRSLGYRAIDMIVEKLANVRGMPARRPVPPVLREQWMLRDFAENGAEPMQLLDALATVLEYPMGNSSPRFFAWVNSPPAPLAILGELLAAAHNASAAGGDHSATYIEHGILNWLKGVFGYPQSAGALLTSGGSVANLIGLAVMRHIKAQGQMRTDGFYGETAPLVVYSSTQGHSCIQKAIELLGFGSAHLRKIAVDADYRMDLEVLKRQIADDRAAGLKPVCVTASAGTVNTGAIDPLNTIADICAAEKLWFHVDGAYGGLGILAEQTQGLYKGIAQADSIAIDPHKWLYMPVECGCVLVRDAQAMRDTFSLVPPYLRDDKALPWFAEFGIQQTRGFKALKLWLVLQQIGVNGYRELIGRDIALARMLQAKIRARPDFELVAAGPLSITCFRYTPPGAGDLDALNKQLLEIVQSEGQVFLTSTQLGEKLVLRACIVNFRTTEQDLETLLEVIAAAGQRVIADNKVAGSK